MTFKAAAKINEYFSIDAKDQAVLTAGAVPVTNPMDKGYVYAALFFYDEVQKEIDKLEKMISKIMDEIKMEIQVDDVSKMLMELSARVRKSIGDDSLDAFIKEILGRSGIPAKVLVPSDEETQKWSDVQESIMVELMDNFFQMTIVTAKNTGKFKTFKFSKEYIEKLTDRQKRIILPALKLVGFKHDAKLDRLELMPDWSALYIPARMSQKFDDVEEQIKDRLKTMIQANS